MAGSKLARLFEAPIQILDEEFKANVHAAFVPPGDNSLDTKARLRVAESGLGEARKNNEAYVVRASIAESKTVSVKRARQVELAFERGEFVMYFQPKVHATYRNIVGAEALMRWHDPSHGVRPPSDFIPYVDRTAVMRAMTWFAIKSSIAQAEQWPDELSVAVNVSPLLFHDDELIPNVCDALSIFGLPAKRLIIEITEDAMIKDMGKTLEIVKELQSQGAKVSIDDFGTGYSSLANFRELPVDELKIDRSFVTHMLDRPRDRDIVKAIIDMAHNLNMQVVAEGVEDNETADVLQQLGTDVLQGYWFSKPVDSEEFAKLLR